MTLAITWHGENHDPQTDTFTVVGSAARAGQRKSVAVVGARFAGTEAVWDLLQARVQAALDYRLPYPAGTGKRKRSGPRRKRRRAIKRLAIRTAVWKAMPEAYRRAEHRPGSLSGRK